MKYKEYMIEKDYQGTWKESVAGDVCLNIFAVVMSFAFLGWILFKLGFIV
jgi:hypothetical protein